jgi:hypothetical protein
MDPSIVQSVPEEKSLQYWVDARNGKKRNYIFDYADSSKCTHSRLKELVQGANWYRCEQCNYAFFIMTAYQQPLHSVVLAGLQNALHFSKEFGMDALQEVARRPTGQYDGSEHKPVLPEGMDFVDTLRMLEGIDINAPDGGESQLRSVQRGAWNGRGFLPDGRARCLQGRKRHRFGESNRCVACSELRKPPSLKEGVNDNSNGHQVPDLPARSD